MNGIFDTHTHYDDEAFDKDRQTLIKDLFMEGIYAICNVTAAPESIPKSNMLAKKYEKMYATSGIHPQYAKEIKNIYDSLELVKKYSRYEKTVAIGEIGLDYYYGKEDNKEQINLFKEQMQIACEENLPVVIHTRDAIEDTLKVIKEFKKVRGIVHCYSQSLEVANQLISLGYKIGFTGVVTFKNAKKIKNVVKNIPIDDIVIETDCPYLAPEPYRGKRCDSSMLDYVVKEISNLKDMDLTKVVDKTRQNAIDVYNIKI